MERCKEIEDDRSKVKLIWEWVQPLVVECRAAKWQARDNPSYMVCVSRFHTLGMELNRATGKKSWELTHVGRQGTHAQQEWQSKL